MPRYNYICNACKAEAEGVKGAPLTDEECHEVIFETSHAMSPTEAELSRARECPRCLGVDTTKTMVGTTLTCYVRGYGYLDRAGTTRDMNLYKLQNEDPYREYRVTGEVDHLESKLKRAGRHDPKPKHYLSGPGDTKAVEQAVQQVANPGKAET